MLVFAARRIRPERGNADTVFALARLRVPGAGRTVCFRRHPALDVPAIHSWIFRLLAQFNAFSQQSALLISVLELAADPCQAVPAPHGTIIRFAETIRAAGARETMRHRFRRVVRFANVPTHQTLT